MKFAYADPPYIGQATKHYSDDPNSAEVDHAKLLHDLATYYDAWALSLSSPTLKQILALPECPDDVRVCAWVKPFCAFKANVNPAYAWEPILIHGGRQLGRDVLTVTDFVSANITLKRGLVGVKPDKFSYWLFRFVGLTPDDEFVDLFPGSGSVGRAWDKWCGQPQLNLTNRKE